jgi:lysophospholipase L1-like esterase
VVHAALREAASELRGRNQIGGGGVEKIAGYFGLATTVKKQRRLTRTESDGLTLDFGPTVNIPAKIFLSIALLSTPLFNAEAALTKLGAMGDSLTDEYWDSGVSTYASNWVSQLVVFRSIDFGPTAAQAGVGTWGEPRLLGYKFNWARSGANSSTLLAQGQHTSCAGQFLSDGVSHAVLAIGANDFNPFVIPGGAYFSIYYNSWTASQIQTYVSQSVSNIETALVTVRNAGVSVALANVIDPGLTPSAVAAYANASSRDRVTAAIQSLNSGVKNLAQKYQVPLMDWYGMASAVLGPNANLHTTLKVGNVAMNLRGSDSGSSPTNAFVSDGFHPNTVIQGMFADLVLQAFASGYGANTALFSEQELLNHAGIAYGGADTLPSQISAYTNYIVLPVLPRFTAITLAGTNVTLKFSTVSNQLYLVERSDDLVAGSWTAVTNNLAGNGALVTLTNAVPFNSSKRFYRVRQLP